MMNCKWNPAVEVESANGVRVVNLYTKQLMNRNIFIDREIDTELANDVLNQLMYLLGNDDAEDINIFINSPGGEVQAGLMIYDLLQSIKTPVNMYCTGMAASMAAVIFASGQRGRRYIFPHAKTMIHEPLIQGGVGGSATSIKTVSDSILETKEIVNDILAKHTGKSREEINKATAFDNYLNANESIEFGLCDLIGVPIGTEK